MTNLKSGRDIFSWCTVLLLAAVPGLAAHAQQTPSDHPYTIERTVRRVVLDVGVTDKDHRNVKELAQRDFTVLDNGAPQTILSFEAHDLSEPLRFVGVETPQLPPDTYMDVPGAPERGPLYVIVYDMMDMGWGNHYEDQMTARQALERFLDSKPAGTRFELYLLAGDLSIVQGFTSNRALLLEAFDVARQRGHIPWVFLYKSNYRRDDAASPFDAMLRIARTLDGLPGRKNLIWMSSHFPVALLAPIPISGPAIPAETAPSPAVPDRVRLAVDLLNAAQISVYPIDVQGLSSDAANGGIDTIADEIARDTGGRAYYNRNDFSAELEDATENGGSYYEFSYAPSDSNYDGKLHKLEVKLRGGEYSLQYRRYYFADDTDRTPPAGDASMAGAPAHRPGDSMYAWMEHGAPEANDVLFRAHFTEGPEAAATTSQLAELARQSAYSSARNKVPRVPGSVRLRPVNIDYLVLDRTAGNSEVRPALEFAAVAYDVAGVMLNSVSQNALAPASKSTQDGTRIAASGYIRAEQTLEAPANAAWLRVAVRDLRTDRIGTIEIPLPLASETSDPDPPETLRQ